MSDEATDRRHPAEIELTLRDERTGTGAAGSNVAGRVSRLVRLVNLVRLEPRPTVEQLTRQLGISRRTLFRDFKTLQDAGVPIRGTREHGYQLDPNYALDELNLSAAETIGLLLLEKLARAMPDEPMFRPAIEAIRRVVAQLPEPSRLVYDDLTEHISFKPGAVTATDRDDEHFRTLQMCIDDRRICRVEYRPVTPHHTIEARIRPLHLHCYRNNWYVFAYSEYEDRIRMFRLRRFDYIEPLDDHFAMMDFSINEFLDDAWGIVPEGAKHTVQVRFSAQVARSVTDVQWHHSQQIEWQADGSCVLHFYVNGLNEIKWWILGFGDAARVLKPAELRRRVAELAENIAKLYADDGHTH